MKNLDDTCRDVIVTPAPFYSPRPVAVPYGASIHMIVDRVQDKMPVYLRDLNVTVEVNGAIIPRERWNIMPSPDDHVLIYIPVHGGGGGGGGKNPLRTILTVIVAVIAIAVTIYAPSSLFFVYAAASAGISTSTAAIAMTAAFAGMAVLTAGTLLINAMFPMSIDGLTPQSHRDSPTYSIGGARNRFLPFGVIPVVLGKYRCFPPMGAKPYTEIIGNDEYVRMVFIDGYGAIKKENFRIGNTPLSAYTDYEIESFEGRETDDPITLFPGIVHQEQIGVEMTHAGGRIVRAARPNVDEISVDIVCPAGMFFQWEGNRYNASVMMRVEYREIGEPDWIKWGETAYDGDSWEFAFSGVITQAYIALNLTTGLYTTVFYPPTGDRLIAEVHGDESGVTYVTRAALPATYAGFAVSGVGNTVTVASGEVVDRALVIQGNTSSAIRGTIRLNVDRTKSYEIGLTRRTSDRSDQLYGDVTYWQALRGILNEDPIRFPYPLAKTAIRIKATQQLSGIIDELNYDGTTYAPVWDGDEWTGDEPTQNPAALIRYMLLSPANPKRDEVTPDDANLGAFYEFCELYGYKFNQVRDFQTSVWETIADIAATARAAPTLTMEGFGVIWDDPEAPIVQHITPRNSWGFSAEKALIKMPHGFRVRFNNENNGYVQDERIIYGDGYNVNNATVFESFDFRGITDPDEIWRYGRYQYAQALLRPESFTVMMDFEHLACARGSKVLVAHDVPMWGSYTGRVKAVLLNQAGTHATAVMLDEKVIFEGDEIYACRFRAEDGDSIVISISNPGEGVETHDLVFETAVAIDDSPSEGDLAMFGVAERETTACYVKSIERQTDFIAKLTLVDVADEIYDADAGPIPEYNPNITTPVDPTQTKPPAPIIVGIESGTAALEAFDGGVKARIRVNFVPGASTSSGVMVREYQLRHRPSDGEQWDTITIPRDNSSAYVSGVSEGLSYHIQMQAVSVYGIESGWTETATETVIGQDELPSDVTGFSCNIIGQNAYLSWDPILDIDYSHCRIKWSPDKVAPDWTEAVSLVDRVGKPATSVTVPALVGSYLIKAIDYAGYQSENAAVIITSIARVTGMNIIETISQPTWSGTGDDLVYDAGVGGLVLDVVDEELVADGTYELADVVDLGAPYTSRVTAALSIGAYNITEDIYGYTDLYAVANLYGEVGGAAYSVELQIATTDDDTTLTPTWSAWKKLIVGDYTARGYKFRIVATGTPPNVSPIVYGVDIEVDMEDRLINFNAEVPIDGVQIDFDPPFYAVPEIGLSVFNGVEGDSYEITGLDETGFFIEFFNNSASVARTVSGIARSYGSKEV